MTHISNHNNATVYNLKCVTVTVFTFSDEFPFYVLVETAGSNAEHDTEKLGSFLEEVMGDGTVLDGVLAQDDTQSKALWQMREEVSHMDIYSNIVTG